MESDTPAAVGSQNAAAAATDEEMYRVPPMALVQTVEGLTTRLLNYLTDKTLSGYERTTIGSIDP